MFKLTAYRVPAQLENLNVENLFSKKDVDNAQLLIKIYSNNNDNNTLKTSVTIDEIAKALSYIALTNDYKNFITIYHELDDAVTQVMDFDWIVDPQSQMTFSNYFFIRFYDEIYVYSFIFGRTFLSKRGAILKRLASLSFKPWKTYDLELTGKMRKEFFQYNATSS